MLVSMKKVNLFAMKEDRDAILRALQKTGEVMLIPAAEEKALPGAAEAADEAQRASEAITFLDAHTEGKKPMFEPLKAVPYEGFREVSTQAKELTLQVENLSGQIASLRNEAETMRVQVEKLAPWLSLEIPIEELKATENTEIFAGYVAEDAAEELKSELAKHVCEVVPFGVAPEGQAMMVVAYKADAAEVKHLLKSFDFTDFVFPKRTGTAAQVAKDLTAAAQDKDKLADELEAEAKKVSARKDELHVYYDQMTAAKERMASGGQETEKTFHISGWCRADRTQVVKDAVDEVTEIYDLQFADPAEDEVAPTVLENNKLVAPYEAVTDMYSRPATGAFDPNPILAPFFCCFFGMMVSDAGYGVVLTIVMYLFCKIVKPRDFMAKLSLILLMGGLSTVFWGAAFGGWFGLTWHPFMFEPMREPLKMLALCFSLGAAHLVLGMLVKIYVETKRGNGLAVFLDVASWLFLFFGLLIWVGFDVIFGKYLAIAFAVLIVLTGGRAKKGLFSKLFSGLLTLYGISSYVSDVLSYSRLFALGLATGVIAMLLNTVGELMWNAGIIGIPIAIVFLLGGHIFNLVINVMGAYVHSSRLQYIEFFGKFYESGGRAFVPLSLRTKYTQVTK